MKKYAEDDYDLAKYADVGDELPIWSAPFGLKLLDYIDYKLNISAVDIGFGTGFPLTEIAMRLGNSSIVYGIDPWKEAVERTKKKLEIFGIDNVTIIDGVAESIPLKDNSIDLITSNNGTNNVNDIDQVFRECARIIKKKGQFVQTMNLDTSMFEFYDTLKKTLAELGLQKEIESVNQHISQKRPDVKTITYKLQENGFRIKDLEYDQFNYLFSDGTAMLNHYFIRIAFMGSWRKLLPVESVEKIFDIIEEKLNQQAQLLGKLKLSIPFVLINATKE
ncbi:class I SAM-dependent methyltransferase [uncultured Proteiniphilum sp.]|uniref:class I SAM-dependent methyltransferase n=1 Tax=uncultured Proteiniphilum sp. TaxID=497637 RepID=UPI002607DFC7|nr:class I SAM-dependent methyltransferase [uncultured Proteiniphilum sp.]